MSENRIKATIHNVYEALKNKDVETMLSYCTDDVTLTWGYFVFEGKNAVKRWAEEMLQMFPEIEHEDDKITVNKNIARHNFVLVVTTTSSRKGILPAMATYDFNNEKIQHLMIAILPGLLILKEEEHY